MKDKQIRIPDAEEIKRWKKVKLKERMSYSLPPRLAEFQKIFKDCDIKILDVFGIGKNGNTLCICKKINNEHAPDCLEHPHLMVCVIDPRDEDNILEIRSLFLEPVEFLPTEKTEPTKIETEVAAKESIAPEAKDVSIEDDDGLTESQTQETVVENFLKASSETERMDLIVAHLDAKGLLTVCLLDQFAGEDFIFDYTTGAWLFGDAEGVIGKVTLLGKDHNVGFIILMEGEIGQIRDMAEALLLCRNSSFREELREINAIISGALQSSMEKM